MKSTIFGIVMIIAILLAGSAFAQGKPNAPAPDTKSAAAAIDQPQPQVAAQDRQAVAEMQAAALGYARAIAALQKELDAVNAEFGRTVQRLQAAQPGYELRNDLTYVKKPEPAKAAEPKTDRPPQ
jgi:hypothetical protein